MQRPRPLLPSIPSWPISLPLSIPPSTWLIYYSGSAVSSGGRLLRRDHSVIDGAPEVTPDQGAKEMLGIQAGQALSVKPLQAWLTVCVRGGASWAGSSRHAGQFMHPSRKDPPAASDGGEQPRCISTNPPLQLCFSDSL